MSPRRKPTPRYEGEIRKAHDVRLLRTCAICDGLGLEPEMIRYDGGTHVHPACYYKTHGEGHVLRLMNDDLAKFRISDVPTEVMKKMLRKWARR